MPHIKAIRRFTGRPRIGVHEPSGRYIIRLRGRPEFLIDEPELLPETESDRPPRATGTLKLKGSLAPLKPLTNHYTKQRRKCKSRNNSNMRSVNIEFKSLDIDTSRSLETHRIIPRIGGDAGPETPGDHDDNELSPESSTSPLPTLSENLCKWCLSYVGTRRKFCSADCAAQFRLCQRQREQKQNLNISVDYYGNVKLSIQGQPISEGKDGTTSSRPFATEAGVTRRSRRRRRCRFCAKLLVGEADSEFCDDTCQNMAEERTKREDFVNVFQQKEVAERRRIRKWLLDAQDQYTRQTEGQEFVPERHDLETPGRTGVPAYSFRRHLVHYVPERLRINRDEMSSSGVTGGPVTLNPIPIRKHGLRPEDKHTHMDPDKRELRVDLKWIPKFYG